MRFPLSRLGKSAIFIAPHYDDVVLSCGGTVAGLIDRGIPATHVTLFGGEITHEATHAFARAKHARWVASAFADIVPMRKQENLAAMSILGCASWDLGFPDAIYRGDRYTSNALVYGGLREDSGEQPLLDLISLEVSSVPEWREDTTLFVPLGIGSHVDHCVAFAVGLHFARTGRAVYAYEDCPYAIHTPGNTQLRLRELAEVLGPPERVGIGATLARRLDGVAAYASQVPNLFRFNPDFREAITEYANQVGGPLGPAERFWPING